MARRIAKTPPPRRKSCKACVKAKRRCDLQRPSCFRCTKLCFECVYTFHSSAPSAIQQDDDSTGSSKDSTGDASVSTSGSSLEQASDQTTQGSNDNTLFDPDIFNFSQLFPDTDVANNIDILSSAHSLPVTWDNSLISGPVDHGRDCGGEYISTNGTSRMNYGVLKVKAMPGLLVRENATGWLHSQLYKDQMPHSMQDAVAACALYEAKNTTNSTNVFRIISAKVDELVFDTNTPRTPVNMLARVQAMLLYQIIRLFDGDVRQRANGEAHIPLLSDWAFTLHNLLKLDSGDGYEQLEISSAGPTGNYEMTRLWSPSWENWVFKESAHRTCLFTFYLISLYEILKFGSCSSCTEFVRLAKWTASASRWNAASSFDWSESASANPCVVVNQFQMGELMERSSPNDVDDFTKLMMVTVLGFDDIRQWFKSKGCDFQA